MGKQKILYQEHLKQDPQTLQCIVLNLHQITWLATRNDSHEFPLRKWALLNHQHLET